MTKNSARISIALLGFGHVGKGVFSILEKRLTALNKRLGVIFELKYILVRSPEKYQNINFGSAKLCTNFHDILYDKDISIVIELMGGENPAFNYISEALKAKKHVITANKEVMAKHQNHFFKLARDHDVDICFEAAVAGGIPIIRALKVGFAANEISTLYGILNGTTNYILSKIQHEQRDFSEVLKQAQTLGLAEADPHMDVSGLDAAYKLVLLAGVAFKKLITLDDVYYEGIENITLTDIQYAQKLGYVIKLLAIGKVFSSDKHAFKVHPTLIPNQHPLAGIHDETNAVFIDGDAVGESLLAGKGAGGAPTASAVVSDLIDLAFDLGQPRSSRHIESDLTQTQAISIDEGYSQFYLRLQIKDEKGALEQVSSCLNQHNVSIAKLLQSHLSDEIAELVLITHNCLEKTFIAAKDRLNKLAAVKQLSSSIRLRLDE